MRLLVGLRDLPPGARPREARRTLGLERFAPPLLIAGRVDLEGADLSGTSGAYLGLSPKQAGLIRFREPPAYLLTIENFASFNRHVLEAGPDRLGTTMYVGGYPSLGTQQALRTFADAAPEGDADLPLVDIDPDGTWIFHTIEGAIGRPLLPNLMSAEIAEVQGKVPASKGTPARRPASSGIFPARRISTEGRRQDAGAGRTQAGPAPSLTDQSPDTDPHGRPSTNSDSQIASY
ncbi:hypothetical protein [Rhodopseudomonas sp.]|uniref:hypothetical protein n=1 Tax=Rhodopseudomonas sp. TaxID=1078 RepID=UPI0039E67EE4